MAGSGGVDVEYADLNGAGQLFDRQQSHMTAIGSYVSGNCAASGAFTGLMSLMRGRYTECLTSATTGMSHGATVAEHCSSTITATRSTYLANDRAAYDAFAAKERAAGRSVAPYQPPAGGGPLGPAQQSASQNGPAAPGGGGAGNVFGMTKALAGYGDELWKPPEGEDDRRPGGATRYTASDARYDAAYDRGHAAAASRVPNGTAYTGSADADGNIVNDKRPGSAWSSDTGDVVKTAGEGKEAVDTVKDVYVDGKEVYEHGKEFYDAVQQDQHVHQVASGASNTGSYDWATGKGGTW